MQPRVSVVARVEWDDGTTEDIDAYADQWTRIHVGLKVHKGRSPRLWLRVADVRRKEPRPRSFRFSGQARSAPLAAEEAEWCRNFGGERNRRCPECAGAWPMKYRAPSDAASVAIAAITAARVVHGLWLEGLRLPLPA
jgi:hypothetical protein